MYLFSYIIKYTLKIYLFILNILDSGLLDKTLYMYNIQLLRMHTDLYLKTQVKHKMLIYAFLPKTLCCFIPAESRLAPDRLVATATDPKENVGVSLVTQEASVLVQKPENRVTSINSQEIFANVKGSSTDEQMAFSKNVQSSATQSSVSEEEPQGPVNRTTEMCVDSKKVILSSNWQDGRDLEEHSLVKVKLTPCEENSTDSQNDNSTSTGTQELFLQPNSKDSQEGEFYFCLSLCIMIYVGLFI